jgi:hypothetical protein
MPRTTPKTFIDLVTACAKAVGGSVALALAALVFFPFQWLTSVPAAILLLAGSTLLFWALVRRPRKWVMLGFFAALLGFVWATMGVFVFTPGIIYCFKGDTSKPFTSALKSLGKRAPVGHFFYIADPIRTSKVVSALVGRLLSDHVMFLQVLTDGSQTYIKLPMNTAVRHTTRGVSGSSGVKQLFASYFGPDLTIDLRPDRNVFTITSGVWYGYFIYFVSRTGSSHGLPWEAIPYSGVPSMQLAMYAAETEAAIDAASLGDFGTAFDSLDAAYAIAPNSVERARCLAIDAGISSNLINGSLGETQSTSYLLQALQEWRSVRTDIDIRAARFDTEVDLWLFTQFRNFGQSHTAYRSIRDLFSAAPGKVPNVRSERNKIGRTTYFRYLLPEDVEDATLNSKS